MSILTPAGFSAPALEVDSEKIDKEFDYSPADFQRIRSLIYERAGINLHPGKHAMVYSRVSRRLRVTGHKSFGDYLKALQSGKGNAADKEWQEFVNCLTTNLTSFFREGHHFVELSKALAAHGNEPIRIWCNAASTGEEPYSLAMTVVETLGPRAPVRIICSDIDTKVLATARAGIYSADARGLSPERLQQHFLRGKGENIGRIRIKPEVARFVEFRTHNLMDTHWSLGEPFDYVFCRNVMIYFDDKSQREVLQRIHATMKPHSTLFVGHSENFTDSKDLFILQGKTIYVRTKK